MKIICTSDWHLGKMFHGIDCLPAHRHFFDWLLDCLKREQPDALLVSGDVFDNANPSSASRRLYYDFLAGVAECCPSMLTVITAGNHDSASRLEAPRPLLERHRVEIRGNLRRRWIPAADDTPAGWEYDFDDFIIPLTGADGSSAAIIAVPYIRTDFAGTGTYSDSVNSILRRLAGRARELYPASQPVMMTHLYASGALIAARDASEQIVVGGLDCVDFGPWPDHPYYMTCGHIHRRQRVGGTEWARYCGSVLPMSFAETNYRHGVDLVKISADAPARVEFLEYTPTHRLAELPLDAEAATPAQIKKLIAVVLPPLDGPGPDDNSVYVSLKVLADKVDSEIVSDLEAAVAARNAILCRVRRVIPAMETNSGPSEPLMDIDDVLSRDPVEAIDEAYRFKHKSPLPDESRDMLRRLVNEVMLQQNN